LALLAYFAGLPIDVTRDAGKYATISKEIFQNGNYINLTVHGDPYDQKPPLLFWLGALGFSIGGISNFWFKLPVLLVVFFGLYSAFRLGKSLYNKRVGLITVFLMAFSFIYPFYSMDIHTDTPMQAFITFSLWQLADFIQTKRNRSWILGFFGIGLAMLCKGPLGAAIPAFAVAGHLLLKKDFKSFTDYRWYVGILLAFAVVSPALIGLVNQFGREGIEFFFWENNVGRLTGTYVKSNNDPLFYVHNLLYLFLPWSLLFYMAAFCEFKTLFKNKFRAPEYFTFTGIWIFFILLNVSKNQLPNYIFGIMPLIALLTAKWIDIAMNRDATLLKIFKITQTGIVVLSWIAILVISLYLFPIPGFYFWVLIVAGITATVVIFLKAKRNFTKLLLPSAIALVSVVILLNMHIFPYIFSFQAPPKAARYFSENAAPGEKLYNYHYGHYELFFYSEPQAAQIHSEKEMKEVAGEEGNWIFTDVKGFNDIEKLALKTDTVIEYRHLYLNRGGRFINPKTRDEVLKPMYLIKY
jgi:4-amino-4-deoxy-L-arabinose transferase-like glycosyltransferase